jgi:hypothetical protein
LKRPQCLEEHTAIVARWSTAQGAGCEVGMCEKCVELDAKIGRYEQMARLITDQRTLDGIAKAIEEANAEKTALHPERDQ